MDNWLDNRLAEFQKTTPLNLSIDDMKKLRYFIANYAFACRIDSSIFTEVREIVNSYESELEQKEAEARKLKKT